jgi:hypothetical protein
MKRILLTGILSIFGVVAVSGQINLGPTSVQSPSVLNGTAGPANSMGSDGDFYLNTSTYCLYGPKAAGMWPPSCASIVVGYTAENSAHKGAPGGYAPLDSSGLLPATNLPASAVTTTTLANATVAASLTTLATSANATVGGDLNVNGNVYAGVGGNVPSCVHFPDANQVHDTVVCAPTSGYNGTLTLPASAPPGTGSVVQSDGSGNLSWTRTPRGASVAPSIGCGAGAGTGCSANIAGTNNAGKISVTTGSSPATNSALATITFSGSPMAAGGCVIGPASELAAALTPAMQPYVYSVSSGTFVIYSGNTALGATTYAWWYLCL